MTEESQRDAMNDAIRAQRERGNVPKSMLPPEDKPAIQASQPEPDLAPEPEPQPEPEPVPAPEKRGFFSRLLGR